MCAQRRLVSTWASAQSVQSSLCAQWVAKDQWFLHLDSKGSDQTGRILSLIWAHMSFYWFCHALAHIKLSAGNKNEKSVELI